MTRTIEVSALARVEGEGGLMVQLDGDSITDVQLRIYEPPRFFEGFLRGRHFAEVPDLTARICGICPVAYQMTSVLALERALGVEVSPQIDGLRRLFYCAEYIESHALHMFMLQAPDLTGHESALTLAQDAPDLVRSALRLKRIGNEILTVVGGRSVHPVNACVGGFYSWPDPDRLRALLADLEWGLQASVESIRWAATLPYPEFDVDYEWVALHAGDHYAVMDGEIRSSVHGGLPIGEYENQYVEVQVPHSTALHSETRLGGVYQVGPLARFNVNFEQLRPEARRIADEVGLAPPLRNPYRALLARGLELIQAFADSIDLIGSYTPEGPSRADFEVRAGQGAAATEAPRGLLFHRYQIDDDGLVQQARIVPPTAQNLGRIEADLRQLIPGLLACPDDEIQMDCEALIRAYDPCISCSTHFLTLKLDRG